MTLGVWSQHTGDTHGDSQSGTALRSRLTDSQSLTTASVGIACFVIQPSGRSIREDGWANSIKTSGGLL